MPPRGRLDELLEKKHFSTETVEMSACFLPARAGEEQFPQSCRLSPASRDEWEKLCRILGIESLKGKICFPTAGFYPDFPEPRSDEEKPRLGPAYRCRVARLGEKVILCFPAERGKLKKTGQWRPVLQRFMTGKISFHLGTNRDGKEVWKSRFPDTGQPVYPWDKLGIKPDADGDGKTATIDLSRLVFRPQLASGCWVAGDAEMAKQLERLSERTLTVYDPEWAQEVAASRPEEIYEVAPVFSCLRERTPWQIFGVFAPGKVTELGRVRTNIASFTANSNKFFRQRLHIAFSVDVLTGMHAKGELTTEQFNAAVRLARHYTENAERALEWLLGYCQYLEGLLASYSVSGLTPSARDFRLPKGPDSSRKMGALAAFSTDEIREMLVEHVRGKPLEEVVPQKAAPETSATPQPRQKPARAKKTPPKAARGKPAQLSRGPQGRLVASSGEKFTNNLAAHLPSELRERLAPASEEKTKKTIPKKRQAICSNPECDGAIIEMAMVKRQKCPKCGWPMRRP